MFRFTTYYVDGASTVSRTHSDPYYVVGLAQLQLARRGCPISHILVTRCTSVRVRARGLQLIDVETVWDSRNLNSNSQS